MPPPPPACPPAHGPGGARPGMLHTAFNGAVVDLLDDLCASFPSCRPLAGARQMFEVAAAANKRAPLTIVHDCMMVPYGDRIRAHDEAFFMERDYAEDIAGAPAAARSAAQAHDVVGVIKGLWRDMSAGDKQCVFQHLDVIVELYDSIQAAPALGGTA